MSKFHFRLEVIRRLRQRARDAQRRVLAEQVGELDRVAGQMGGLMREIEDADQGRRTVLGPARLNIELLRSHQIYRGWLDRKVVETGVEVDWQQDRVGQERAKLAEVSRRLKVVEELRERQWKRHQTQCSREEQAEFDELAIQGYLRRRPEPARPTRGSR